ncbi:hypothetical protein [Nocardia tengchongensis]
MTDHQVHSVTATAVTPLQRVVVALVAVYAIRGSAMRNLLLDDVDLAGSRILLAGTTHRLTEFTHAVLTDWLAYRHQRWPHTSNPHVIVSRDTALNSEPVEAHHLTWHLSLLGIELEQIRADRVLTEALATDAGPLHLATTFGLSDKTTIDYAAIARTLSERPIEAATSRPPDWE